MMKHFRSVLFVFAAFLLSIAPANTAFAGPNPGISTSLLCPLPPPASLTINAISTSSVSLQWPAVPGAASYKISMYDVTNSTYLSNAYTTGTSYNYGGLTPGYSYIVGVSASSCLYGATGAEITASFVTSIIIVDEIVSNSCTPSSTIQTPAGSFWVSLTPATDQSETVQVKTFVACHSQSLEPVKFNLWADCDMVIHYTRLSMPEGFYQTPAQDGTTNAVQIKQTGMSSPVYFTIDNACVERPFGVYTAKALVSFGSYCSSAGNVRFCTFDEEYDCSQGRPGDQVLLPKNSGAAPEAADMTALPNPFTDALQLSYVLTEESSVSLSLLDLNGKTVRKIQQDGLMAPGRYVTAFQGEDLPAGVYFIVLQTDQGRQVTTVVKNP